MVLWGVAGVLTVFTVVRLAGAERGTPLVQAMAFTPYAAPLALLAAAAAAITGATGPWLLCILCWAALTAAVIPRLLTTTPPPPPGGVTLRVMTANVLYDQGDVTAVLDQAKVDDVDILAIQELTTGALTTLDTAGIDGLLPYRVAHPSTGGHGSALFSRHPLTPADGTPPGLARRHPCGMLQAGATVHIPGAGPIHIESAHPCAPRRGHTRCWARDLAAQPPAGGPTPRILLGDFNATLDHAPLRRLLRTGYRDAAATRGRGLAPTWPFRRWRGQRTVPWVTLDHVLADQRITITDAGTRPIPGSDHRAVYAELHLPATAA